MLGFSSFEAFKADVLSAFPVRPKSFAHIIQTNLQGAATLDACPTDKRVTPQQFEEMIADGAVIVDARDSAASTFRAASISDLRNSWPTGSAWWWRRIRKSFWWWTIARTTTAWSPNCTASATI